MPNIPKLLAKHLGKQKQLGFHAITLVRVTPGVLDPENLTGGTTDDETSYSCKGRVDTMTSRYWDFAGDAMERTKFVGFMLLGATLAAGVVPRAGDRLVSRGVTYTIAEDGVNTVQLDTPATHLCACMAPGGG